MSQRVRAMWVDRLKRLSTSTYASHRVGRWAFPSKKEGKHITTKTLRDGFNRAKTAAKLPADLVLYCTRHTFGTDMAELRNPKLTMTTMGHRELKTTMRYQHPQTSVVADFLDQRNAQRKNVNTSSERRLM
jgi:integrase